MEKAVRQRIAFALKCTPEEVPDEPQKIAEALEKRRAELKAVKNGKSIH